MSVSGGYSGGSGVMLPPLSGSHSNNSTLRRAANAAVSGGKPVAGSEFTVAGRNIFVLIRYILHKPGSSNVFLC